MKKVLLFAFLFWGVSSVYAQLVLSSGSQLVVNDGSVVANNVTINGGTISVNIDGSVVANNVTNDGGTITNDGNITISGNVTNNSGTLMDPTSSGTIAFEGVSTQEITGTASSSFYGTIDINNASGVAFTNTVTGADQTINGTLNFTSGSLTLNAFNLTIGVNNPTGVDASKYIVTNGAGTLKRSVPADGSTTVTFPVGNSAYNPVTLQNSVSGVTDMYAVKVVDNEPANSFTDHMVNRSWVVGEDTPGGSDLAVTPQWVSGEELVGFDFDNCGVGLIPNGGVNYIWGEVGAATGSDPYWKTGEAFTFVGTFAVGDFFYAGKRINLTLFLEGPYFDGTMKKTLNTKGLIPMIDPYSLGTTVTTIPSDAVDWVVVRLRDKNNSSSILSSHAFFVNQSGQLLDVDGSVGGKVKGAPLDNYFIEINHRNHNGVMTLNTVDLTVETPSFNYSLNSNIYGTNAQADIGSGVFGLRKGNVNGDGRISKTGPPLINDYTALLGILGVNTSLLSLYSYGDINMDGDVRKVGPLTINDYTALLNSLGINTSIIQQLP